MAKVKEDSNIFVENVKKQEPSYIAEGTVKCCSPLENNLTVYLKVNIYLPYDPANLFLGIYPREMKT